MNELSLDLSFISSYLEGGKSSIKRVLDKGFRGELLEGNAKEVFEFVSNFFAVHSIFPSKEAIKAKFDVELPDVVEPVEFFAENVVERSLHLKLHAVAGTLLENLKKQKPREALTALEAGMVDIRKARLSGIRAVPISSYADEILAHYEKIEGGWRGIQFPWNTINEATLGLWPADLCLFVAKSGVGKTWAGILTAITAVNQGKRVLFCTTELTQFRIAFRTLSASFGIPYQELFLGKLSAFNKVKLSEAIEKFKTFDNMYVIGGQFEFYPETLLSVIQETEPDLVIFDGAYLLKTKGNNRTEQAAASFNAIKSICLSTEIPFVVTMQMNREAKANQSATMTGDAVALTSASIWNADLAFALYQDEAMFEKKEMEIIKLKARETTVKKFMCRWDFENMDFSEIPYNVGESAEFSNYSEQPQDPNVPF